MPKVANNINTVMLYVNKEKEAPCWVWWGAELSNGYGKVTVNYETKLVHRYVYENLVGPIPEDLQLDHLCLNKLCVNPEHLEPVTCKVNMERRAALVTSCIRGHPLSGPNLYMTPDNRRQCRTCRRESSRRFACEG